MSTSPTLISWRRKSSVRKLSSANVVSVRSTVARSCKTRPMDILLTTYLRLEPSQPKPKKLIGAQGQQIRKVTDARKHITAEHLNRNIPLVTPQIEFDRLRAARKIVHH